MRKKGMVVIFLLLMMCVSSCDAQENDSFITRKKGSLRELCKKRGLDYQKILLLNPHLDNDILKKDDTVFLLGVPKKPVELVQNPTLNANPPAVVQQPEKPYTEAPGNYEEQQLDKQGMYKTVVYNNKRYFVCIVDPGKYQIELFNKNGRGTHTFQSIAEMKKADLMFAMNGGMFEEDLSPVGLFVSETKMYKNIDMRSGMNDNFHMKPNGVFMLDMHDKPIVLTSEDFVQNKFKAKLATQSGPMLVVNGTINANFRQNSQNLNIRNGVGVADGRVFFVVSKEPVNFYEFSELFRDKLKCNNALYLDGVVTQYIAPPINDKFLHNHILAIFLTVSKPDAGKKP